MTLLFARRGTAGLLAVLLGRNLHVHDDAVGSGRNLERRIFHICGFFAEDGTEQTFFRREFGLGLRGDFADEDVAGLHFRADADHAVGAEVLQRFIAEVRDVARDFFRSELRVAGRHFKLVDVDRREDVVLTIFSLMRIASSKL